MGKERNESPSVKNCGSVIVAGSTVYMYHLRLYEALEEHSVRF
jgi:hypothetical protein